MTRYFLWCIIAGILANVLNSSPDLLHHAAIMPSLQWKHSQSSDSESLSVAFTCFVTEMRFIARFANNSLKTATGAATLEAGSCCHFALVAFLLQTHLWRYTTDLSYSSFNASADLVACVFWCFATNSQMNCLADMAAGAVILTETVSSHMLIWEFRWTVAVLTFISFALNSTQVAFSCWSQPLFRSVICKNLENFILSSSAFPIFPSCLQSES